MFETFGEYMYYLLFSPLKKAAKTKNQFNIFCKVVGKIVDEIKDDIFRVREESMIISASDIMLPEHGLDRGVRRLKGETIENYRTRLMMQNVIAAKAGTNEAIYYVARSFGYDNVEVERNSDPARWAEATVRFIGGKIVLDDKPLLLTELNKIKPASALLTLKKEQQFAAGQYFGSAYVIGKFITIRQG